MDHSPHDQQPASIITIIASGGALEGASNLQQSLRRLVRRRTQLPRLQVRAGRIRGRLGWAVSRVQGETGALGWGG